MSFVRLEVRARDLMPARVDGGRIRFDEPCLKDVHVALSSRIFSCFGVPFSVRLNGAQTTVILNRNSLTKRFHVSERLIEEAQSEDDLKQLALYRLFQSGLLPKNRDFFLSADDYRLDASIFTGREILAYETKELPLFESRRSTVIKARLPDGELVACKIFEETAKTDQMIAILREFCGKPGIVDLRGVLRYRSSLGKKMVATFHSLYHTNLNARIIDKTPIPEEIKIGYVRQLFMGLRSLDGAAHFDLKPPNIFLANERLVLGDLEFMWRPFRLDQPNGGGTRYYYPPERFSHGALKIDKYDVWAAGMIILMIFVHPKWPGISWLDNKKIKAVTQQEMRENGVGESNLSDNFLDDVRKDLEFAAIGKMICQEAVDQIIARCELTEHQRTLVTNMFMVDVHQRWTVRQAEAYFLKNIDESIRKVK
jgi:serine/threonine protein kinase